jgi:hypothetical protein
MQRDLVLFDCRALYAGQQAQEIVTDRPDVTEASTVVPVDSIQIENGLTQTSDHGSGILDFSESLVRYGLSHRTEFRIDLPNIFLRDVGLPSALGVSDLSLGVKQQLGPLAGSFDLAVIAALIRVKYFSIRGAPGDQWPQRLSSDL